MEISIISSINYLYRVTQLMFQTTNQLPSGKRLHNELERSTIL